MTDEEFARLDAMARITRARMDVIERTLAAFMASADRPLAMALEDMLRTHIEHGVTSQDEGVAERLRLSDEAAVRFADVLAQALARKR